MKTRSTSVDVRRSWYPTSSPSHSTCTFRYTVYTAAHSLPQQCRTRIPHTKAHLHTVFSARQRVLLSLPTARAGDVPHKGTQIIDLREQQSPLIVFALATNTDIVPDMCRDVHSGQIIGRLTSQVSVDANRLPGCHQSRIPRHCRSWDYQHQFFYAR